jgi:2-isopropylmalate synthase
MPEKNKIIICDTTLRDGAQGEGVFFSSAAKVRLARKLDEFGIDFIEGGYAGSNRKDMEFFAQMAEVRLAHAQIVAFGSTRRAKTAVSEDEMVKSLLAAGTPVVTIVGKSSRMHVKEVLRTTPAENLAMISDTVSYFRESGRKVFYDAEHFFDGFREDPEYAVKTLNAAARAGADVVVLCDTNGGRLPYEIFDITRRIVAEVKAPVGIHVHNDAGVAVANTLEGVRAGAVHVQGTLNGLGERCGNADLVAIMPALEFKMGLRCVGHKKLSQLKELSAFMDELVAFRHKKNAPYVGESAFSHKAGSHANAVKKNPSTFEHMAPESVGNRRRILISELSGGSSVLLKAIELGLGQKESKDNMKEILRSLKDMESKGYAFEAADASFKILVQKVLKKHRPFFGLEGFRVMIEKRGKDQPSLCEATIKVRVKGEVEQTVAEGDGPVNALDRALRKALQRFYPEIAKVVLTDFRVRILDPEEATAAKTQVLIESSDGKDTWGTVGVSGNIIEASWEALVDSVEYKLFKEESGTKRGRKKR